MEPMISITDEMIERAARAIAVAHGVDPDGRSPGERRIIDNNGLPTILSDWQRPLWEMWIEDARAALYAALAPSAG